MQTLSNMRRNSTHHHPLAPYILFIAAIVYESLASMTQTLSPLLGLGFYYIFQHIHDETRYLDFALISLYALYVEFDRSLMPLSFVFFALIFYKVLFSPIKKYVHCQSCLIVLYIGGGYLGYFLFNLFIHYVLNLDLPYFSLNYLLFIFSDLIIALVVL